MNEDDIRKMQGARLAAARLAADYRSARAAAKENNWPESTYRAHESGTRTIGRDDADRYARVFRLKGARIDAQSILFGGEQPFVAGDDDVAPAPEDGPEFSGTARQIAPKKVLAADGGTIEAGAFRSIDEFNEGPGPSLVDQDEDFPFAKMVTFTVAGDSMNALSPRPIMAGDRVICIDYQASLSRLPFRAGMVVVVERVANGGHLRERSVKQLEIYDDRFEFHPRSTNRRHQPIIVDKDSKADDGTTVTVIAIVREIKNKVPL